MQNSNVPPAILTTDRTIKLLTFSMGPILGISIWAWFELLYLLVRFQKDDKKVDVSRLSADMQNTPLPHIGLYLLSSMIGHKFMQTLLSRTNTQDEPESNDEEQVDVHIIDAVVDPENSTGVLIDRQADSLPVAEVVCEPASIENVATVPVIIARAKKVERIYSSSDGGYCVNDGPVAEVDTTSYEAQSQNQSEITARRRARCLIQ